MFTFAPDFAPVRCNSSVNKILDVSLLHRVFTIETLKMQKTMAHPSNQDTSRNIPKFVIKNASYANITQKDAAPKRDQGIILDCADTFSLTDYISATGDLVQPNNIICAVRISRNWICIHGMETETNYILKHSTLHTE